MHPTKAEMYTMGRDSLLAHWNLHQRKQIRGALMTEGPADAIAISNSGKWLAIGYNNGALQILDAETLKSIKIRRDRKKKTKNVSIQVIKFSPDDRYLAVGGHDRSIITYDVQANFKPMKRINTHNATVNHIDFSQDGESIMSLDGAYEILFHNITDGSQITHASQFKDEEWATWTSKMGWPVQGIFPPCADGTDINSCDRSPDGQVLATGDDFRMVKLFKYPCPVEEAQYQKYSGHSEHVTNVQFSRHNKGINYLISTGGEDKCIMQWKYDMDGIPDDEQDEDDEGEQVQFKENPDISDAEYDDEDDEEEVKRPQRAQKKAADDPFAEDELDDGDERGCMELWRGVVDNTLPDEYKRPSKAMSQAPE